MVNQSLNFRDRNPLAHRILTVFCDPDNPKNQVPLRKSYYRVLKQSKDMERTDFRKEGIPRVTPQTYRLADHESLEATLHTEEQSASPPTPEGQLPVPRWLGAQENLFGIEILDCRPITLGTMSTTKDPEIARRFLELRGSSGQEFRGVQPKGARSIHCDLTYPHEGQPKDGPLFKAEQMEDKWTSTYTTGTCTFPGAGQETWVFGPKSTFRDRLLMLI